MKTLAGSQFQKRNPNNDPIIGIKFDPLMIKANKKRNPFARQLRHFKNKIIKNKRRYDRKKEQQMLHHSQAL